MNLRLHPSTVWQAERRNALRLLQTQKAAARRAGRHDSADALMFAAMDVEDTLRRYAAWAIEEAVGMRLVHMKFGDAP